LGGIMASISEPLLGAGASAKNDWGRAEAATSLTFTGEAQFRRGFEIAIGLNALASADAGLSKFVDAAVRGNAFAEATASLRGQMPLNLFDEFGLAIGAQAVAQAAAGIEAGLALSAGDFIALLGQNRDSMGLPLDLVALLLDEATLGGKFEIHVAAAAMAYASIQITGKVVKEAGFRVTADAGLGAAAGVGFGGSLDLGIRDFRKFYGRAVDLAVNSIVDQLSRLLPDDLKPLLPRIRALAPVAATALRVAYEIGDYLAKDLPKTPHQDALDLSNHCVGVVLEEAQRFLFGQFLEAGLRSLQRLVARDVPHLAQGAWNRLMPQRRALADVLYRMPAEPFQPTDQNAAYWSELIAKATDLVAQLPTTTGAEVIRGMAIVFSAAELLTEAIRSRINVAQSYAFAIGAGTAVSPPQRFDHPLERQPGDRLRAHINTTIGHNPSQRLDYVDLVAYLAKDAVIATLRDAVPEVDAFLDVFQDPKIASNLTDVLRALVQNREAFVSNASGKRDPQETLRVLLGVLDAFITIKIQQELVPALDRQISDSNLRLYFDEVLIGTLLYVKNVAFQTVLDWEKHPVDRSAFTEALAAVMTMLLGRSLVLVGDGFMAALQADMKRACDHAASKIDGPRDPFSAMGIPASPELKALLVDTLRVGGEVFGPLPDDTRRNLRFVLYDVMETLPPGAAEQAGFTANLADQFFIPNQASLQELADQLLAISRDRFALFVERVLEAGGNFILQATEAFIQDVIRTVLQWAKDLENAIKTLFDAIGDLDRAIQGLIAQAQQAFDNAVQKLQTLLAQFTNPTLRQRLRQGIADQVYRDAKAVLAGIPLYGSLPSDARRAVRNALRDVVHDLVTSPILDPMLDAIGGIGGELDGVLDDVRELNPNAPLGPQLLDLLIDRMEDRIRDAFGGASPRVDVGFTITVLGFSQHFSLGSIALPFGTLFTILRDAIGALDFYQNTLAAAAAALASAFRISLDLQAKQDERDHKKSDHDRLTRIRGEFSSDPKTITVVSPVQSLVYDDDIDVQIQLGGVPKSYLGLANDEQLRVLVFLNGALVQPQSWTIDDSFPSVQSSPLPSAANAGRAAADAGIAPVAGSAAGGRVLPSAVRQMPASATSATALPLQPSLRLLAAGRGNGSSRPVPRQSVTQSKQGATVVTTALTNVLPGRRMTVSKRAELEQTLPPGTTIRFRADRGALVTGTNTLLAVVLDPGGQRYQQAVSFGVTAAAAAPPGDGVKLPAVPGRKPSGNPRPAPTRIDLHFDAKALGDRLKLAGDFIAKNSTSTLREFRRR
jgi:hypothetical protein